MWVGDGKGKFLNVFAFLFFYFLKVTKNTKGILIYQS